MKFVWKGIGVPLSSKRLLSSRIDEHFSHASCQLYVINAEPTANRFSY